VEIAISSNIGIKGMVQLRKEVELTYKCANCKRQINIDDEYFGIRCPYCGHRVLLKDRPPTVKRIKAE
jgi:DNA-directed RNA polymerase subunit P